MAPVYAYQARNREGERVKGVLEAENPGQIVKQLKKEGYYLTSLERRKEKRRGSILLPGWRMRKRELAFFSQQFSVLIKAGISVLDSLDVLGRQLNHYRLKEVIYSIQEQVTTGLSLSQAMAKNPGVFPELYCQMIKAGERGGALDRVLTRLAAHYERQDEINSKLKTALYYPAAVAAVALIVIVFLLTEVIPNFMLTFDSLEAALPLPTRMVINISSSLSKYWWISLLLILTIFLILKFLRQSPPAVYQLDRLKLKLPFIGMVFKKVIISRFAGSLSLLLTNGVDLLSALTTVEELMGSRVYSRIIACSRSQIREGVLFSRTLAEAGEIPELVVQMIKVGEESGSLEEMLEKVSEIYDQEVAVDIERVISLVEPVIIVLLAVVIGFIVIAVAMPIFEMVEYF